ncbi:MFS transporter [Candidatus Hodarchaeum mangrovi]
MYYKKIDKISNISELTAAVIMHASVEIPFFIFPVILLLVGNDLFSDVNSIVWIGLGSIGTLGTLAAGLPAPIFGYWSEKMNYGSLMSISVVLAACGSLIMFLWGDIYLGSVLGMIILGIALAIYHPPGLAWVTKKFYNEETNSYSTNYNKALAFHGAGGTIGASIGPLSVYFLIESFSWREIYLFWVFPLVIVAFLFWILIGRKNLNQKSIPINYKKNEKVDQYSKSQARYIRIILLFGFIIAMSLSRGMINFIIAPFLSESKNFQITKAALFIGVTTLIGIFGQLLGGITGDKFSESFVLKINALLQAGVILLIYFSFGDILILVLYIVLSMSNSIFWPSTNSLIAKNTLKQSSAFGIVMFLANIVGAFGPLIDGIFLFWNLQKYLNIFIFASLCSFLAFIILWIFDLRVKKILSYTFE